MEKLLVAEDSFALANLLEFVLEDAGYDVTLCRTGVNAWKEAQANVFDLLILDHQMPGMTGVDVLREVRLNSPNSDKPVFLCTAKTHELDHDYLNETLRVTAIFHKPFSPKNLVEYLKSTLQVPSTS